MLKKTAPYGSEVPERMAVWIVRNFGIAAVGLGVIALIAWAVTAARGCQQEEAAFERTHDIVYVKMTDGDKLREFYDDGWRYHEGSRGYVVLVRERKAADEPEGH